MQTVVKAAMIGLGLLAGTAATGHAQHYNYYGTRNTYAWSPQNYPGYQTSYSANPWYYYYPGYGYAYNYPTYNYYAGSPYPAQGRIGTPTSRCARTPTTPAPKPAVTEVRDISGR